MGESSSLLVAGTPGAPGSCDAKDRVSYKASPNGGERGETYPHELHRIGHE